TTANRKETNAFLLTVDLLESGRVGATSGEAPRAGAFRGHPSSRALSGLSRPARRDASAVGVTAASDARSTARKRATGPRRNAQPRRPAAKPGSTRYGGD